MSATVTTASTSKGKHQKPIMYTGKLTKKTLQDLNDAIDLACYAVGLAPTTITSIKRKATKK